MRLRLAPLLVSLLVLTWLVLFGQKAGLWMQPETRTPLPPTPAALETRRLVAQAAAQEAARQAEAERLAAVQQPAETPDVLPPGEAQEEVFHTCTACHSTGIIRRTRLSRERWDELMDWMVERHGMNPMEPDQRRRVVDYLAEHFPPQRGGARGRNPFLPE